LIYWRGGDYAGIGPGAHGRLTLSSDRFATTTALDPLQWLRSVEVTGTGELTRSQIDPADQMTEFVMMSLRLAEGMSLEALETFPNHDAVLRQISRIEPLGYLKMENNHAIVQPEFRILLNAVLREILV
jgi:oxygen-independent coproporphyrinogen-3 oxidase